MPSLPLSRWRLDGDLLELTREDLALTPDEIAAFLLARHGVRLTYEEARMVLAKTEGWIAGVLMLGELLEGRDKADVIRFLRDFGGGFRVVYDYFAEEVFGQQSPPVQRFLLHTSILSELHRDLVNPLLGVRNAQSTLESLAANHVFLASLDESNDWYKYHPLFGQFLKARLEKGASRPELARLHKKAATAYASQENWGRAIDHLCAAEDYSEAASVVERVGYRYVERGNLETVHNWLSSLPAAVKHDRPWLLMLEGRVARARGRYQYEAEVLERAASLFAQQGNDEGLLRVAIHRALLSQSLGDSREAVDHMQRALGSAPNDQMRAEVLRALSLNYRQLGELERSASYGEAALQALAGLSRSAFHPGLERRVLRVLIETYLELGYPDHALSLVLKARELCAREQLGNVDVGWVLWTLGAVRAVRGEPDLALEAFQELEERLSSRTHMQRYRVNLWRGQVYTDLGDYDRAEACYQQASFPPAEYGWLALRQQQVGRAIAVATESLDRMTGDEPPLERARLLAVLGMAQAADGRRANGLELLGEAIGILTGCGYLHRLASLQLHAAGLQIDMGQSLAGVRLLRATLATAENRGFYHFYWWDPALLSRLLGMVLDYHQLRPYIKRLVDKHQSVADRAAFTGLAARVSGSAPTPSERIDRHVASLAERVETVLSSCSDTTTRARLAGALAGDLAARGCVVRLREGFRLTWREVEVFLAYYLDHPSVELEAAPALGQQVASELCMAENTLKSHLKSIRRKLGVPTGVDRLQVYRSVVAQEPS